MVISKKNNINLKLNKITDNLVNTCNRILVERETDCNCFDTNKYPTNKIDLCKRRNNSVKCKNYNKCKNLFTKFMSGSEPIYNPDDGWSDSLTEKSHNCYTYMLDDQIPQVKNKCLNICRNKGHNNSKCSSNYSAVDECSILKPQPGDYADEQQYLSKQGNVFKKNRNYTCKSMREKILIDSHNPKTGKSNIFVTKFNKACPKHYYKGGLTIEKDKTYHFYRQDKNSRYSHKQGTLRVENLDANKKPIYAPHLADKNYNKQNNGGINYDTWCDYYCIPRNYHLNTHAAGGNVKIKSKKK